MLFYTECAVPVLISAVLTAHLSVGANSAPPGLLAGFWGGRRRGKGIGKKPGGERKEKGGEERGRDKGKERGKQGKGKERKGRTEEEGRNFVQL